MRPGPVGERQSDRANDDWRASFLALASGRGGRSGDPRAWGSDTTAKAGTLSLKSPASGELELTGKMDGHELTVKLHRVSSLLVERASIGQRAPIQSLKGGHSLPTPTVWVTVSKFGGRVAKSAKKRVTVSLDADLLETIDRAAGSRSSTIDVPVCPNAAVGRPTSRRLDGKPSTT